jgi:hypothetical protein
MGILSNVRRFFNNIVLMDEWLDEGRRERLNSYATQRDYYVGNHRQQLKVKANAPDDNLVLNFSGLIVDRGVAMLLGQGLTFDLPGDAVVMVNPETGKSERVDPENQRYVDAVWAANKKDILMQKTAQFGGVNGTCYFKLQPDYHASEEYGSLPRLIALDPIYMTIETDPHDIEMPIRYTNTYATHEGDEEIGWKEVIERNLETVDEDGAPTIEAPQIAGFRLAGWFIRMYRRAAMTGGRWELVSEQLWEYEFPPVLHWQNLPLAGSVYGKSDISDDVLAVQDRINFVASNISKIIRYHAHPKTWGRGVGAQGPKVKWGADELVTFPGDAAMIANLEMQSDLGSSAGFLAMLRQAVFDIARTVDLASMQDKLGALTNFGLRVLFFDSLAKLDSKRELYGEALTEVNRRMLVLWDAQGIDTDGGAVVWPEVLPVAESEQVTALQGDIALGLLSKETAAGIRGYDWMREQARIQEEREGEDSIGARLLSAFERGQ